MLEIDSTGASAAGAGVNSHGCRALRVASKNPNAGSRRAAISVKMSRSGCLAHAGQVAGAAAATACTAVQPGQK